MATVGLARVLLTLQLPQLKLTASLSMLPVSLRQPVRTLVGMVSPSAVWYTSYLSSKYQEKHRTEAQCFSMVGREGFEPPTSSV